MEERDSIYKVSRKIKKRELHSLYNALRSIYHDSLFVGEIAGLWPELPLLANLRCGLWYSSSFYATCYFKSTDGHTGNWSFNTSRLNMHVALLAAQRGGCFIVDATRQGKRFPDSFSKTVPIWACVLNCAVNKYRKTRVEPSVTEGESGIPASNADSNQSSSTKLEMETWDCSLHLPLWVSDTEKEKIERQIDEWVNIFGAANADIGSLSEALKKPLQPLWISQNTVIWLNEIPDATSWTFTPIILVSASQPIPRAQRMIDGGSAWNYIPGAADDEESWARGLIPALFWKYAQSLLESPAESCTRMVARIVERDRVSRAYRGLQANQARVITLKKSCDEGKNAQKEGQRFCESNKDSGDEQVQGKQSFNFHWIGETNLAVGNALCGQSAKIVELVDSVINCGKESQSHLSFEAKRHLHLPVVDSKHDRFSLQNNLYQAVAFAKESLTRHHSVLIICADGEDLSVCVCLTILLALFNGEGSFDYGSYLVKTGISKWDVRQRLVFLCKYATNARPSRGNLRQVFHFLSNWRYPNPESPDSKLLQGYCQGVLVAEQGNCTLSMEQEFVIDEVKNLSLRDSYFVVPGTF